MGILAIRLARKLETETRPFNTITAFSSLKIRIVD
jgi:hypothetical protein